MAHKSLEEKFHGVANLRDALRNSPTGFYVFPVPDEHTNWRDEQTAWMNSAVLFDQSYHMSDVYVTGPDKFRLLSELSINDFSNFGPMRAVQMVNCADDGYIIGDAIVFHLANGSLNIIGKPASGNWISFVAASQDYDVEISHTHRVLDGNKRRRDFRLQLQGPNAFAILEACNGGSIPDTRFFGMCEFKIGDCQVTGLRHGMADAPGMEFWGPYENKQAVLDALNSAGEPLGMRRGGGRTYSTAGPQSGWVGSVLPAIYSGDDMLAYREWLPADGFEAMLSIGGSYMSDQFEDYYMDPWDLAYHRLIHWQHDFKGRNALLRKRAGKHRKKVWLRWNKDDVLKIVGSLYGDGERFKYLQTPAAHYATIPYDQVTVAGRQVGISVYAAYTVSAGSWFSIGILNEADIEYGEDVSITWGEPEGVTGKLSVEPHQQTEIRATISRSARG